eukprot:UN26584
MNEGYPETNIEEQRNLHDKLTKGMSNSDFCLIPKGITSSSRRLYEAINYNC